MSHIQISELSKDVFAQQLAKKAGVNPEQLRMGIDVEREHAGTLGTSDMHMLAKIAIDHLKEKPDYYTGLKKMEKEGSKIPPEIWNDMDRWERERRRKQNWEKERDELNRKNRELAQNWEKSKKTKESPKTEWAAMRQPFKGESKESDARDKQIKQWNTRRAEWDKDKTKTPKRTDKGMDSYLDTDDVRREDIDIAQGRTQKCRECGKDTHKTGGYCSIRCQKNAEGESQNEVSTSAGAGAFMTPKAFSGKKWKRKNSVLDKKNKK